MIRIPVCRDHDILSLAISIRFHSSCHSIRIFEISNHTYENIGMMTTLSAAESYPYTPQMGRRPGNATLLPRIPF